MTACCATRARLDSERAAGVLSTRRFLPVARVVGHAPAAHRKATSLGYRLLVDIAYALDPAPDRRGGFSSALGVGGLLLALRPFFVGSARALGGPFAEAFRLHRVAGGDVLAFRLAAGAAIEESAASHAGELPQGFGGAIGRRVAPVLEAHPCVCRGDDDNRQRGESGEQRGQSGGGNACDVKGVDYLGHGALLLGVGALMGPPAELRAALRTFAGLGCLAIQPHVFAGSQAAQVFRACRYVFFLPAQVVQNFQPVRIDAQFKPAFLLRLLGAHRQLRFVRLPGKVMRFRVIVNPAQSSYPEMLYQSDLTYLYGKAYHKASTTQVPA